MFTSIAKRPLGCPIQSSCAKVCRSFHLRVVTQLKSFLLLDQGITQTFEHFTFGRMIGVFPTNISISGWHNPKLWVTCRMCYGVVSPDWPWRHLAPPRDVSGLVPNTHPSNTCAQAPVRAEECRPNISLNVTGSCPRWQLLWGRFGEGNPRLVGALGVRNSGD